MYDKEKEAAATVEPREESGNEPQQRGSIAGLAALWWRRASSNTYEGSFRGSKEVSTFWGFVLQHSSLYLAGYNGSAFCLFR